MSRRNTIAVAALAALFYCAFMFLKHHPGLRNTIPFGDDPYDGVGSGGVIVAGILTIVALVRAFRPSLAVASSERRLYLVRTQVAIVLCVWMTLAADAVAMARHVAKWTASPSHNELLAVLGLLAIASIAVFMLIAPWHGRQHGGRGWLSAVGAIAAAMAALALYPEQLIENLGTHLVTCIAADLILFAPMRPLLSALVPDDSASMPANARPRLRGWGAVLAVATAVGVFAFLGEMSEGSGSLPVLRVLLVAGVFIGLAVASLLIAYAFVGKPLGFGSRA